MPDIWHSQILKTNSTLELKCPEAMAGFFKSPKTEIMVQPAIG